MKILAIVGSLREGSWNKKLAEAAVKLVPQEIEIEVYVPDKLPLYNADLDPFPGEVQKLKEKVKAADAILFVSPEHNYSVPAVLKNAIEWVSRPHGQGEWIGRPAAVMGGSTGIFGGVRAQFVLRQIAIEIGLIMLPGPEVTVPEIDQKFDEKGNLTDEHTKEKIKEFLEALVKWVKLFRS